MGFTKAMRRDYDSRQARLLERQQTREEDEQRELRDEFAYDHELTDRQMDDFLATPLHKLEGE